MLRSTKEILGYKINAVDGDIGKVHDFFFGDKNWAVRYLVADTGQWLPGRKVLISPSSFGQPNWAGQMLAVNLTKEKIEQSPPVEENLPVSRRQEAELAKYYGWPTFWDGTFGPVYEPKVAEVAAATAEAEKEIQQEGDSGDPHLRSIKEVMGYHIKAEDGEIGHVEDFIVNTENWRIPYLVVDTKNWLPGRSVIISPVWTENIDWAAKEVQVDLTRDVIKNSPEFDPARPINREYEERLYDYYGRPPYWT